MKKRKFDWTMFRLRFVRRFWNIVFYLTRVPFVNDYAGRMELDAMKKIIDRTFDCE